VVAKLADTAPAAVAIPDNGEIDRDLHAWLDAFTGAATDRHSAALILALIAAAAENPDDAEALYGQLTGPRRQGLITRLHIAADTGQIRADADLEAIADAVLGSIVIQLLTGRATATGQRVHGLLDILLRGLRPDTPA
jgi:hypothetical protein